MPNKLSIIVPVYNSENYLVECLDSICKQIKNNIELILINDGSTDKSIKICNKYKKKFNFIKLINLKKNKGVSFSRNAGIRLSLGEFICFVDSDDQLLPGSIKNILNYTKIHSDYNFFIIRNFVLNKKRINFKYDLSSFIPNEKKNSILNSTNCWNFVIKKKFLKINKIYFKNLKVTEDWVFVSEMLCLTKKFKIIKKPAYMHRMYEPNTLGKKTGYLIVMSRLKVISEIAKILFKRKIYLNKQKIKFLKRLLELSTEQMYSNLILCNSHQIKNASKYLDNYHISIKKLSKISFNKLNNIFSDKRNIEKLLLKYKLKSYEKLKNILKKSDKKNAIVFCAGGYGKTALKILLNSGAKVDYVVDNNPLYLEKKIDNFSIKSPYFLKKNINKFFDYNIFICNKKNSVFGQIKLQLKNIGFENKNIIHFNM